MSKSVVIVGAGAAGLSAAVKLYRNGVKNVIILEASKKIGGRINTEYFGKTKIDLGAQWCHGEEGNVVHEMVQGLDLLAPSEMYWDNEILISNGDIVPKNIVEKLEEMYEKMAEKDPQMATSNESVGGFMINKYKNLLLEPNYSEIDKTLASQYLDWCHKFENSIDASDTWFQSSAKGNLEYQECPGHPVLNWKGEGYAKFLDVLMNKYPNKNQGVALNIHHDKEVTSINWQRSSFKKAVKIICKDKSTYEADIVLVTVSLGVLKNSPSLFDPPLPDIKMRSINNLGFGLVDKIFLRFDQPWWLPDWNGIKLLWTDEDKEVFMKKGRSENWIVDLFGFYTVDKCPDLLCGWITGPSAKIMESLSDKEVMQQCSKLLRKFVLKHRPGYRDPIAIKRSTWGSNPYVLGSYSLRTMATESSGGSALELSTPVVDSTGREAILFAGEATSPRFFSTVHGAVESGFREGDRILSLYEQKWRCETEPENNVIIVGAGISGLAAAHVLSKTEISKIFDTSGNTRCGITVLEAKSRAGGRIHSVNFGPHYVESGAQWLHGSKNKLFKLSEYYKLLSDKTSAEGQGVYINENGFVLKDSVVNKVDFVIGEILENLEEFADNDACDYPNCVKGYLEAEFNKYISSCVDDSDEIRTMKQRLYKWHERFQIIDNSCFSLSDLSAKAWGKYSFEGENSQAHINFVNGYRSVIDKLCEGLPDGVLKFDKEICSVQWSDDHVKVITSDGDVFVTDFVIITVSLGVLKKNYKSWFKPSLPENVVRAIEDMGFATINKVFLQYDEEWWGGVQGFQLVWYDDDSKCDVNEPSSWIYDMSGFDVLYPGAPNTLVGWVGATGAVLVEQRTEHEVADDCTQLLRRILKKPIPFPSRVYRSQWNSDPHILGSYCHTRPICDKNNSGWGDLSAPILDPKGVPRILLAGEACSEQFFSTTHGAMRSGIEQAEFLLDYIDLRL